MLKVVALGGLGEIGLNMLAFEFNGYILLIDAGLMFPEEYMTGVDVVIPDFQYLREQGEKVKAIILTHGHEDHIGAMPFFLKEFDIPVFGTGFTLALLQEKLREHGLMNRADLRKITAGDKTKLGPFTVEYIAVTHSIVDGVGLAIETPEGILVHSGDFKVDHSRIGGQSTDLTRFAVYGERGVLALLSDSTNAEKEGSTPTEEDVRRTLEDVLRSCPGRVIVATFASNIPRIRQVIDLAWRFDRKVVFNGKSMVTNVRLSREQGFIDVPQGLEIAERQIDDFPDKRIAVITTGSQGEPMSALTRMAQGRHKGIRIKEGDTVILSSRFIPGNENAITTIINSLYRLGARVIYEKVSDIHTSGHAKREELKLMMRLVKPQYFIPIHGEYRHLVRHAELASDMGISGERVLVVENGQCILFEGKEAVIEGKVQTGRVFVDGKGVGDVEELVLKDRRRLSENGIVIAFLAIDKDSGETVYGPDVISRGFVVEDRSGFMLEDAKALILEVLDEIEYPHPTELGEIESEIRRRLRKFFYKVIGRTPLIIPTVIAL